MKHFLIIAFLLISLSGFSQTDTSKKIVDSAYFPPDTTIIKIPSAYLETFAAVMKDQDYSHKMYMRLLEMIVEQVNKQMVKKPKK